VDLSLRLAMKKRVCKIIIAAAAGATGAAHVMLPGKAAAADLTDAYYVGASIGQSSFQSGAFDPYLGSPEAFAGSFLAQPLGWKILAGTRPFSFLGAEVEYVDFGDAHHAESGQITGSEGEARGGAAFAVGYLPVPMPNLDVFGKVGVARYRAEYHFSGDFLNSCVFNPALDQCVTIGRTTVSGASDITGLAYGIGAQYHFGVFAVRAEFERISTTESATAPSLLSVGITYRF
jgi:hypothetical protein